MKDEGPWGHNGPCPLWIQAIYYAAVMLFLPLALAAMAVMFLIYVPMIAVVKLLGFKWI